MATSMARIKAVGLAVALNAFGLFVLATTAHAQTWTVPEPEAGTLTVLGSTVAAVVIVGRLTKRK